MIDHYISLDCNFPGTKPRVMKRALRQLSGGEAEASRAKRRKEMAVPGSSSDVDITSSDPVEENGVKLQVVDVREQGMKLWQTVRDAVNKE